MKDLSLLFEELGKDEITQDDVQFIRLSDSPDTETQTAEKDAWRVGLVSKSDEAYAKVVFADKALKEELRSVWLLGNAFERSFVQTEDGVVIR